MAFAIFDICEADNNQTILPSRLSSKDSSKMAGINENSSLKSCMLISVGCCSSKRSSHYRWKFDLDMFYLTC
jgi:hypothetical protein